MTKALGAEQLKSLEWCGRSSSTQGVDCDRFPSKSDQKPLRQGKINYAGIDEESKNPAHGLRESISKRESQPMIRLARQTLPVGFVMKTTPRTHYSISASPAPTLRKGGSVLSVPRLGVEPQSKVRRHDACAVAAGKNVPCRGCSESTYASGRPDTCGGCLLAGETKSAPSPSAIAWARAVYICTFGRLYEQIGG